MIRWVKSGWLLDAIVSLPQFLCSRCALQHYGAARSPYIPSDIIPKKAFESNNRILHELLLDVPTLTFKYWITTGSILLTFTKYHEEAGYDVLYFTPIWLKLAWKRLYPGQPISNKIYIKLTETAPQNFHSLASSMSTWLTPTTTPIHNYQSNAPVDPMTVRIALMHQTLYKKATLTAYMKTRPSPTSA